MTVSPHVELLFNPEELNDQAHQGLKALPTEAETIHGSLERALLLQHIYMASETRKNVAELKQITPEALYAAADFTWQLFAPKFVKVTGPEMAVLYAQAMRAAKAGDVSPEYVNALASEHARRLSEYFHNTSRDAMIQGFNTLVNRKVPARAAADRVLSAYGLTARQMSGLTSNQNFDTKVNTSIFHETKQRLQEYVGTSVRQRIKLFADQEEHNLSQQAEQIAWMWRVEHGQASSRAEKIWITAKDEKTCKVCGPMHGHTALVSERFEMPDKSQLWVPGPHPNCRCVVKFREPRRLALVQKDLYGRDLAEFNDEHPRGEGGRFSAKARTRTAPEVEVADDYTRARVQAFLDQPVAPEEPQKIDLRGTAEEKVDLRRTDLRRTDLRRVDLTEKVPESERVDLRTGKMDLRSEMTDLRTGRIDLRDDPKPKIEVKPRQRVEGTGDRPKTRTGFTNTVPFLRENGQRQYMYAVFGPDDLLDTGYTDFNAGVTWTPNPGDAEYQAIQKHDELVATGVARVQREFEENSLWIMGEDSDTGESYQYQPTKYQVKQVVEFLASQNDIQRANWIAGDDIDIEGYDSDGNEYFARLNLSEIAEDLQNEIPHLHPSDFAVRLVRIDEGHEDERTGMTDYHPGHSLFAASATVSGPFKRIDGYNGRITDERNEKVIGVHHEHWAPDVKPTYLDE